MSSIIATRAIDLAAGDVITRVGRTAHSITVTEAYKEQFGGVKVFGFTPYNPEPRLMFRGLDPMVPVGIVA